MISQRGIVELAQQLFSTPSTRVTVGVGEDDCAVVITNAGRLLVSTDLRNHRRHLEAYHDTDFHEMGRFVVRQNVSDILGSGGAPRWFILSIALPGTVIMQNVEELFNGVRKECDRFEAVVVGGDTKQGDALTICGTIIGEVVREPWLLAGATSHQDIWVSGKLGGVTAAVCLLERSSDVSLRKLALQTIAESDIPYEIMRRAISEIDVHCGSDISDGLGVSLHNIMRRSKVGMSINSDALPLHPLTEIAASIVGIPVKHFAFGYGGDFQFVLVADRSARGSMTALGFRLIGYTERQGINLLTHANDGLPAVPDFGHADFMDMLPGERFIRYYEGK